MLSGFDIWVISRNGVLIDQLVRTKVYIFTRFCLLQEEGIFCLLPIPMATMRLLLFLALCSGIQVVFSDDGMVWIIIVSLFISSCLWNLGFV